METLILPRNCENCAHFDGDVWCSLPWRQVLIQGPIQRPALTACVKHEPKDSES